MGKVTHLQHNDVVRIDRDRMGDLTGQLGPDTARNVVMRATEELTVRLMQLRAANAGDNLDAVSRLSRSIAAISDQLGLVTLARVARDVSGCATFRDRAAFRATFARLQRISEICLLDALCMTDEFA